MLLQIRHGRPNIRIRWVWLCKNYLISNPFGFCIIFVFIFTYCDLQVFRKGSPLAADVSTAILRMTESGQMKLIQDKWFSNQQNNCSDSNPTTPPSYSLGLESFWVLFCITGFISSLAPIIFVLMFFGKHKHVLLRSNSNASTWRRIRIMLETFDHKEMSSGTHRNYDLRHGNNGIQNIGGIENSPNENSSSRSASSHLPIPEDHATFSTVQSFPVSSSDIELIISNEAHENRLEMILKQCNAIAEVVKYSAMYCRGCEV